MAGDLDQAATTTTDVTLTYEQIERHSRQTRALLVGLQEALTPLIEAQTEIINLALRLQATDDN